MSEYQHNKIAVQASKKANGAWKDSIDIGLTPDHNDRLIEQYTLL